VTQAPCKLPEMHVLRARDLQFSRICSSPATLLPRTDVYRHGATCCLCRWVNYYLSQDPQGPTVGVPYNYVAPDNAFVQWRIPAPLSRSTAQPAGWAAGPEEVGHSRLVL
jgi:hypothetical protein